MSIPLAISVIDDDRSVRLATNNLLTSRGYTVNIFRSADEFLQSAELKTTSCVIADVQMSLMGGLELLTHMRSLGHRTPFIFMTAFPDEAVRDRALKAGLSAFSRSRSPRPLCLNVCGWPCPAPIKPRRDTARRPALATRRSLHLDVGRLDHRPPLCDLRLLARAKRFGRELILGVISSPWLSSCFFTPGSFNASTAAALSLATIAFGVPFGTHRPDQSVMLNPFRPASAAVGMSAPRTGACRR